MLVNDVGRSVKTIVMLPDYRPQGLIPDLPQIVTCHVYLLFTITCGLNYFLQQRPMPQIHTPPTLYKYVWYTSLELGQWALCSLA